MKPDLSLIPEPDRSTEARKPLTGKQRAELALAGAAAFVDYDGEAGTFIWRERGREAFSSLCAWRSWNAKFAGKPAFTSTNAEGYAVGRIWGVRVKAHRLAWFLTHGRWPEFIDHIDGDRANNRVANLREVTRAENTRNAFMRKDNTSGHAGVHLHKASGKWRAHIHSHGRYVHLGLFDRFEDAVAARQSALPEHGFSDRHGEARNAA
tara:strand:- start:4763 stop:5386 length:624 start_codon:yes stop_codon:yes gene_type:complete